MKIGIKCLSLKLCCVFLVLFLPVMASALQSGKVEIGDLETGSIVGIPFKDMEPDLEFTALNIGGEKVWYPPYALIDLRGRAGKPILLRITNTLETEDDFELFADPAFAGPTALLVKVLGLSPGQTKYIGISLSELTYLSAGSILKYRCPRHANHLGGQLQIIK